MTDAADLGRVAAAVDRCLFCARPENLKATMRIALVVGVVLTAINEGDALTAGHISGVLAAKVPFNFVVPFVVSNLGLLAARQAPVSRRGPRSSPPR